MINPGDPIRAKDINDAIAAKSKVATIKFGPGFNVKNLGGGVFVNLESQPVQIIPCLLQLGSSGNSGGVIGGYATQASYVYNIFALTDTGFTNKLASNIPLFDNNGRTFGVSYAPATNGEYTISGGVFVLLSANELPLTLNCSGSTTSSSS